MEQQTGSEASKSYFSYRPLTITLSASRQNVLWREKYHCGDEEYAQHLAGLIANLSESWGFRPVATEVEVALQQARQEVSKASTSWVDLLRILAEKQQAPDSINKLIADLQHSNWKDRFVARHTLVAVGGEAVPQLVAIAADRQNLLRLTADWLLQSIEFETNARLFPYAAYLLCPHCLVHCHTHWTERSGQMPFVHYGCRACGQSREFLEWTGKIVTVLDAEMTEAYAQQDNIIRGSWFRHRSLSDCDWVEIIQASDEEIERFAVQVGNDTDELRQPRYEQMRCLIGSDCRLSKNTMRILQSQFGQVEQAGE